MTRKEKLKEIGNMYLSACASKFIIPVPHKFYDNEKSVLMAFRASF